MFEVHNCPKLEFILMPSVNQWHYKWNRSVNLEKFHKVAALFVFFSYFLAKLHRVCIKPDTFFNSSTMAVFHLKQSCVLSSYSFEGVW